MAARFLIQCPHLLAQAADLAAELAARCEKLIIHLRPKLQKLRLERCHARVERGDLAR